MKLLPLITISFLLSCNRPAQVQKLIANPGRFHIDKASPLLTITVPPPVKDTIIHLFQFHGYNGGIDSSKLNKQNKTKQ